MTITTPKFDTTLLQNIFASQQKHQYTIAATTAKERIAKLKKLYNALDSTYRVEIHHALQADFGKNPAETDLNELYPILKEIKHTIKNLSNWMRDEPVDSPFALIGSRSYIKYEAKGVCLLISPWNFPINLTFGPLISAIAAGNTVIIKPSENTPHSTAIMKKIVIALFEPKEIALVDGEVEVATALLALPFNHIFFTGSPNIGKIVMKAAAKHLTSVTLELGGKSPCIIDHTADIKSAAKSIAWGKFMNAGQTCIAPDYVYIHKTLVERFLTALKDVIVDFYGTTPTSSEDYARIVNINHTKRIQGLIDDALEKGAKIVIGDNEAKQDSMIPPTVMTNVSLDSTLMQEEIFGPVLPILTYTDSEEVITQINKNPKPLALYIFGKNKKNIKHFLNNTTAGGTCINNNILHFFNSELPFGGVNTSGIGKSKGIYGFKEFSNARGVYKQLFPGAVLLLMPPYTDFKKKLIRFTMKWF